MDERNVTPYDTGDFGASDGAPTEPFYQPDQTPQSGMAPEAPELNLEKAVDGIAETKKRNYERYLEEGEWTPEQQQNPAVGTFPGQNDAFQQSPYGAGNYQPVPANDYSYSADNASYNTAGLEEPVSLGEWIVSMLLMLVPCANIILMFVWAFSKTEKKSKSNYFKATLIFSGIILALYIIMMILIVIFAAAMAY